MKKHTIIRIITSLILLAIFIYIITLKNPHIKGPLKINEEILFIQRQNGTAIPFKIEIAKNKRDRSQGLMERSHLPKDNGMLFIFDKAEEVSMWMKNTLIPLDMIFIGEDKRIKSIAKNTTPNSLKIISSGGTVIAVLEINAMLTDELSIKEGDLVIHPELESFEKK